MIVDMKQEITKTCSECGVTISNISPKDIQKESNTIICPACESSIKLPDKFDKMYFFMHPNELVDTEIKNALKDFNGDSVEINLGFLNRYSSNIRGYDYDFVKSISMELVFSIVANIGNYRDVVLFSIGDKENMYAPPFNLIVVNSSTVNRYFDMCSSMRSDITEFIIKTLNQVHDYSNMYIKLVIADSPLGVNIKGNVKYIIDALKFNFENYNKDARYVSFSMEFLKGWMPFIEEFGKELSKSIYKEYINGNIEYENISVNGVRYKIKKDFSLTDALKWNKYDGMSSNINIIKPWGKKVDD